MNRKAFANIWSKEFSQKFENKNFGMESPEKVYGRLKKNLNQMFCNIGMMALLKMCF